MVVRKYIVPFVVFMSILFIGITIRGNVKKSTAQCPKCNIVVIVLDALRADELPCYGYERNTAPNICRFGNRNVLFEQTYSQASWSLPSHMSFFSSEYPSVHQILAPDSTVLPPSIITLPEAARRAGYVTEFAGPTTHSEIPLARGIGRGFSTITDTHTPSKWIPAIDRMAQNSKKHIPTLLYLHTNDLLDGVWQDIASPPATFRFDPYYTKPANFSQSEILKHSRDAAIDFFADNEKLDSSYAKIVNSLQKISKPADMETYVRTLPPNIQALIERLAVQKLIDPTNPVHTTYMRNFYDERLYNTDAALEEVFARLDTPELSKNTIVVLLSDHGYEFGEHGFINMGSNVYPATTHIPFLLSAPGAAPERISSLTQKIDIYPTLLTLTGISIPGTVLGKTVTPLIGNKEKNTSPRYAISELDTDINTIAFRFGNWSYLSPDELYFRPDDPEELNNVASKFPYVLSQMKTLYANVKAQNYTLSDKVTPPPDPQN